jgi:D-alanyl-D-alanine carboxypeptidase/D-alanyl-D-alanine-endopeptidase (penicillin-binding protein 4)
VLAAAVAGCAAPTAAAAPADVQAAIAAWTRGHRATSALVWRLDPTGAVPVAGYRPDAPRLPASTMKLVTAAGALIALGPEFRFSTRLVIGPRTVQRGKVLHGPVFVEGGGDPVLATPAYRARYLGGRGANLARLTAPLRVAGVRLVRGPIVADESVHDGARTGPQWKYGYRFDCPPLSGLSVDENQISVRFGAAVSNPPLTAVTRLRRLLRTAGVRQTGGLRIGRTPANGKVLGSVTSPPLRVIVRMMNPDSDNFIAETLAKDVGAYAAGAGSTAAGTRHTGAVLRRAGILGAADQLVDGSGLSRANRLTATSLVRLLTAAAADPTWGRALVGSLAHGGEGTLRRRFLTPAIGRRVHAKTGYLNGVSSLAGVVTSRRGHRYVFAFLMNEVDVWGARATQDRVVTMLAKGAADPVVAPPPA